MTEFRYTGTVRINGPHATDAEVVEAVRQAFDAALQRVSIVAGPHERFAPVVIGPVHLFRAGDSVQDTLDIAEIERAARPSDTPDGARFSR